MITKNKQITGVDIADLRDELGIGSIDLYWLFSSVGSIKMTGEKGKEPLTNPSTCILARYLSKYPEENIIPEMPLFTDVLETTKELQGTISFSATNLGTIFGATGWSGNRWFHGGRPSPIIQRLFYILLQAIENEGQKGLYKFLEIVDQEAKARGYSNGLQEILQNATWRPNDKNLRNEEEDVTE